MQSECGSACSPLSSHNDFSVLWEPRGMKYTVVTQTRPLELGVVLL